MSLPSIVFGKQNCFNKPVQFIQVDSAEYWTTHAALRCPAERLVPAPFLAHSQPGACVGSIAEIGYRGRSLPGYP